MAAVVAALKAVERVDRPERAGIRTSHRRRCALLSVAVTKRCVWLARKVMAVMEARDLVWYQYDMDSLSVSTYWFEQKGS